MKKLILLTLSIVLFFTAFFWTSCSKTGDEGWTDDEKASYEEVLSLQDEVSNNLDEWFSSMDSLDAIDMAQQSFANNPAVSKATINNKGIAVQYANGMRGGLFLKGKLFDYKKSTAAEILGNNGDTVNNLKSLVNGRKMLLMDAAYSEFSELTDQVYNLDNSNLNKVNINIDDFLDSEVTLDMLTQLSGYGIIDMSGHGIAWPKESYITEIYYITGESVSENTSKKYWDEIKTGSIPVVKTMRFASGTKYCVSPGFISNHNDFSNDTVFFYGGFCYSFLGNWPDIIDGFGDGAYLGFDWTVQDYHCADWEVNSLALMSDTSKTEPMTLEEWMNDGAVDKSYNQDGRTVSIQYAGDGTLTLWGDVSIKLIALSDNGAPVSEQGEANVGYPFKCEVVSNISDLEYIWDIGDGSSPVTASDEVTITWVEDGSYELKVEVKDKSSGNSLGTAKLNITIGTNSNVLEYVLSSNWGEYIFKGKGEEGKITMWDNLTYYTVDWQPIEYIEDDFVWNGLNFSATITDNNGDNWGWTFSISGTLSSDGQFVSFVAVQEGFDQDHDHNYYFKLTVDDAPLYSYDESDGVYYGVEGGQNAKKYVTAFEGRNWDADGNVSTVTGIDWDNVQNLYIYFLIDR